MKNPWVIVGLLAVVLFGGAIWYSSNASEESNEGVTQMEHSKGGAEATVTLVEYSDFQCPACAAFQPVLKTVLEQYGEKVKFEYKHFPLPIHSFAQQAALAAEAAGQQGKFFEYHDVLFQNQETWSKSAAPQTLFVQYAQDLGLDVDLFKAHMKSSLLRDSVRADMAKGRELSITGTPTFFLNGKKMEIKTFEDFATQIALAVDPMAVTASSTASTSDEAAPVKFGI